jgi:tetratricopeptide (TPR) repeat protein
MPTVMNGVGTWYYGRRRIHRLKGVCQSCHAVGELESYDTTLYFVVLFVPVLPLTQKRVLEQCPHCKRHRVLSLKKWEQTKSEGIARVLEKLQENPDDAETIGAALTLAVAYQDQTLFDKLANSLATHRRDDAAMQAQLASAYAYFARHQEAEAAFRASLAVEDNPAVRRQLALELLKQGRPDDAVPYVRDILQDKVKDASWLVYFLIEAYQAQGMHQQALELMDLRDVAFPDQVATKDIQKQRKTSVKHLASGKRIKSAFLSESGKAGYREGNWTARVPRLIPIALVAGLLCWYLGTALWLGWASKVYLVNGSSKSYTVLLDGHPYVVMPSDATAVRVPVGDVHVESGDPATPLETQDCYLESPFFSRPFANRTIVINPDHLAVLVLERIEYAVNPGRGPMPNYSLGRLLQTFDGVDYPFTTPPSSLKVKNGVSVTKTHLAVVSGLSPSQRIELARRTLSEKDQLDFEKQLLLWNPAEERLLRSLVTRMPSDEAIEFLRARLNDRPLKLDWHRSYQDVLDKAQRIGEARTYYAELVAQMKQDPDALYLLARVQDEDLDKAGQMLKQAAAAKPPSAYAMYALAYETLTRGDFEEAYRWSSQAIETAPKNETLQNGHRAVLLAAGKYNELLRSLQVGKANPDEMFSTVGLEIAAYAARGDIAKANSVIEETMKPFAKEANQQAVKLARGALQFVCCCVRDDEAGALRVVEGLPELDRFSAEFLKGRLSEAAAQLGKVEALNLTKRGLLFLAA